LPSVSIAGAGDSRRRHEIIGPGDRLREACQRVAYSGGQPRHAIEHLRKPLLLCAESDEHGSMIVDISVRHDAAKDVPELVLPGTGDVRVLLCPERLYLSLLRAASAIAQRIASGS
jgi:hypothetical protein